MLVRPIAGEDDLRRVGRIRYERFVEERRCSLPHADNENRLLLEPLDASAVLLGGYIDGELVGSARLHLGLPEDYRRLYRLGECPPAERARVSVTSRLVVSPRLRSLGRAALRLSQGCFEVAAAAGAWLNFIDCNEPLVGFFHALGFVDLGDGPVAHPAFGSIVPMVLVMPAVSGLRRQGSPFAGSAGHYRPADLAAAIALLSRLAPGLDTRRAADREQTGSGAPLSA